MIKPNLKDQDKHPFSIQYPSNPKHIKPKLSFFGKGITSIDHVHSRERIEQIRELDLSHNALSKVEGLKQFPGLEVVNLAYNCVGDGRVLRKLIRGSGLRSVGVKGNPFLKSGEGKMEAYRCLTMVHTDIEVLGSKLERKLVENVRKYCTYQVYKQYVEHIDMQIQVFTDLRVAVADTALEPTYTKIMREVLEGQVEETYHDYRRQVVAKIWALEPEEEEFQTKERLNEVFMELLEKFQEELDNQLRRQQERVMDRLHVLDHAKKMKKVKQTEESVGGVNVKRMSYALESKIENNRVYISSSPNKSKEIQVTQRSPVKYSLIGDNVSDRANLEQKFEHQYNNSLRKYSPVYQLLFSPLQSLKNKERDLLIETLSNHLKQKSFALFKMQKTKQQLTEVSKKCSEKQKLLKLSEEKFIQYRMVSSQKAQMLETALEEKTQQLSKMRSTVERMSEMLDDGNAKMENLKQLINEYRLKDIKLTAEQERNRRDQKIQDKIRRAYQLRLMREHIGLLVLKANRMAKFRETQHKNQLTFSRQIVQKCFEGFRQQYRMKKCIDKVQNMAKLNAVSLESQKLIKQLKYNKSCQKTIKMFKKSNFIKFRQNMGVVLSTKKQRINKIAVSDSKKAILKLNKCFFAWKGYLKQQKCQAMLERIDEYYEKKLAQRSIKSWLIFMKTPQHLQAEIKVDLKTNKIINFLCNLSTNYYDQIIINQKLTALSVCLTRSKASQYLFKLKGFVNDQLQVRQSKSHKLITRIQARALNDLFKVTTWNKKMKALGALEKTRMLQITKRIISKGQQQKPKNKKLIRFNLYQILQKGRKIHIAKSMRNSLKQFMIQDKLHRAHVRTFFTNVQRFYTKRIQLKSKQSALIVKLNTQPDRLFNRYRQARHFFNRIMEPRAQAKRVAEFVSNGYYKIMVRSMAQWKISTVKAEIERLKARISEFGPEIEQISRRQKITFEEKGLLMNIIDQKQKAIRGFIEQLKAAQYTIKNKQQKYQKLKEYLYEPGQQFGATSSEIEPLFMRPERDTDAYLQQQSPKQIFTSFRRF